VHPALIALMITLLPALASAQTAVTSCRAESGTGAPLVVELYTSEGCNSCPPADRWLTKLKGRSDVITLAFHVDYWDRLGWVDRFGSPAWTRRQNEIAARTSAKFVYTPQIVLNGRDYRGWPALPAAPATAAVGLSLTRDGDAYTAQVQRRVGAPARLAGYWAVTEDGHISEVRAGENHGVTLHHDAVVRELQPLASVPEGALRFTPRSGPDAVSGPKPRKVQFVVTDAATGMPLQALSLGC
jgi:hypothetical protein